jgi:hypothetical protein
MLRLIAGFLMLTIIAAGSQEITANNMRVTFKEVGYDSLVYEITGNADGNAKYVYVWISKNASDIPQSPAEIAAKPAADTIIPIVIALETHSYQPNFPLDSNTTYYFGLAQKSETAFSPINSASQALLLSIVDNPIVLTATALSDTSVQLDFTNLNTLKVTEVTENLKLFIRSDECNKDKFAKEDTLLNWIHLKGKGTMNVTGLSPNTMYHFSTTISNHGGFWSEITQNHCASAQTWLAAPINPLWLTADTINSTAITVTIHNTEYLADNIVRDSVILLVRWSIPGVVLDGFPLVRDTVINLNLLTDNIVTISNLDTDRYWFVSVSIRDNYGRWTDIKPDQHIYGVGIAVEDALEAPSGDLLSVKPNPSQPLLHVTVNKGKMHSNKGMVRIYDIGGNMVEEINIKFHGSTKVSFIWNGSTLPSGTYFISLHIGKKKVNKKIVLIQ